MSELDGDWDVRPLPFVWKRIDGPRGSTRIGPLPGIPFTVRGRELRYRFGLVDLLEPDGEGYRLTATFRGRPLARFRLRRRRY